MPDDRDTLVVDPGPRRISGQGEPIKNGKAPPSRHFDTGSFLGTQVPLGEINTDEAGRLPDAIAQYEAALRIRPDPKLQQRVNRLRAGRKVSRE
jgi:hypothetical protein